MNAPIIIGIQFFNKALRNNNKVEKNAKILNIISTKLYPTNPTGYPPILILWERHDPQKKFPANQLFQEC